jgi:hypothetical protein
VKCKDPRTAFEYHRIVEAMGVIMKNSLLLAGALLAGCVSSAFAGHVNYTFYDNSGHAYCDGLELDQTKLGASGYYVGNGKQGCAVQGGILGGFRGTIPALGAGQWYSLITTDPGVYPDYTLAIYINEAAMTWKLYAESSDKNVKFSLQRQGLLVKGKP